MAEGAAAAAIVGTGVAMYGQYKQGKAEEEAFNRRAAAKEKQAFEILGRSEVNIERLKREAEIFKGEQISALAGAGVDVGSEMSLVLLEQVNSDVAENVANQRREILFKTEQLKAGADIDTQLAGDTADMTTLNILGTGLSGAGTAASRIK